MTSQPCCDQAGNQPQDRVQMKLAEERDGKSLGLDGIIQMHKAPTPSLTCYLCEQTTHISLLGEPA